MDNNIITKNQLIELFISIGFNIVKTNTTTIGISNEYKYYTKEFEDRHYTLVLFTHYNSNSSDFRLYLHSNTNGRFLESLFQISDDCDIRKTFILNKVNLLFMKEIRDNKLSNLGL